MLGFVSSATIDCAYFLTFAVGLAWAVFVLLTGGAHDADTPDVGGVSFGHADSFDVGSIEVSPISPITLSTFITTFGGIGIIARQVFDSSLLGSLIFATIGGLILSSLMFLFYSKFLIGSQGSSEVRVGLLIGLTAEVTVPISETGVGEVAIITHGGRVAYPARSSKGIAIQRGALVIIDQMVGTQAFVSIKQSET